MVTTKTPLYREIANILQAVRNCRAAGNREWELKHDDRLDELIDLLPSGSGLDNGVRLDGPACKSNKLVFMTSFHHMNENGMYDGWTEHAITVAPSFDGIDIHVSGKDRNQTKDYLAEIFHYALTQDVED